MTRERGASGSIAGSSGDCLRVKMSVAMPRSLNADATSRTYTFRPPFPFWPRDAVGEVCMDTTAIRRVARSEISRSGSATVRRSRVEPASGDAAEAVTGDRRARAHNRYNLRDGGLFPPEPGRTGTDIIFGVDAGAQNAAAGAGSRGLFHPDWGLHPGRQLAVTVRKRLPQRGSSAGRPREGCHAVRSELHDLSRGWSGRRHRGGAEPDREAAGHIRPARPRVPDRYHHQRTED